MNPLSLLAVLLASAAAAAGAAPRPIDAVAERYFAADWAKADAAEIPEPKAAPAIPLPSPDEPFSTYHSPVTHMHITRMAYQLYVSRYDGGELSRYIGGFKGEDPDSDKEDTVVEGSYDEDAPFKNPWGQAIPEMRHFWDCRKGPYHGLGVGPVTYDSSVDRSQKYFTGGYNLDGRYDSAWSENPGKKHGTKGQGILGLYQAGNKTKAYYYLGHAAHLLEDLTVPAHALLWPHPYKGADAYETYTKEHFLQWSKVPSEPIDSFGSLYELYLRTGDITNNFDAGHGPGLLGGFDGTLDRGARRKTHFSPEALREEADVLMPLAIRRVASLYLYFFKQVDHTPPHVELAFPAPGGSAAPGPRVTLRATAVDAESGVDRNGFRFEVARVSGSFRAPWTSVTSGTTGSEVSFDLEAGARYDVRVWAVDAAGNAAVSAESRLAASDAPAVASAR